MTSADSRYCALAHTETSDDSKDLLQRLIESKYKDGRYLTDDEITGMIIATLFAGQHTTNVSITWVRFGIARNPRVPRLHI